MEESDRIAELSALFMFLAEHDFAGYSPLYERIARHLAASPDLLMFVHASAAPNARRGRVPVLFLATLHDQTLRHPDTSLAAIFAGRSATDAELADAIDELVTLDRDEIIETMRSRSVQTNEVGRTAAIVAGLAHLGADGVLGSRRIGLVELGPSAGLNLFADRWHVAYMRDGAVVAEAGPEESPVRLDCELRGPRTPGSFDVPSIGLRTGIDPAPIDASDADQARWLRACVWPDVPDRPQRLAAAIAVVAEAPPTLVQGDAVTGLAPMVAAIDDRLLPVVQSTWALAYLSADGRAAVLDGLEAIGATRDLAFLTLEEPRFTPWIETPAGIDEWYETGDGTPTMLGVRVWRDGVATSTALAMTHPHVTWMRWLDGGRDG